MYTKTSKTLTLVEFVLAYMQPYLDERDVLNNLAQAALLLGYLTVLDKEQQH